MSSTPCAPAPLTQNPHFPTTEVNLEETDNRNELNEELEYSLRNKQY